MTELVLGSDNGPGMDDDVRRQLLARRIVLVHGFVGDAEAAETAAALMLLDATGDERIVVRMTAVETTLDHAISLMDVVGVLGVPIDMVGSGTIAGGAVGVFACGRTRVLAPHARLRLREPDASVSGRAIDIERTLAAAGTLRDRYFIRLSALTARPLADVAHEWESDRFLEPEDAVTLGYADGVEETATRRGAPS